MLFFSRTIMEMSFLPLYSPILPLVCLGGCNKIPWTWWLTKNTNLFLRVLEAGRMRSRCWQISCLGRDDFLVLRQLPFTTSPQGGRGKESPRPLYKSTSDHIATLMTPLSLKGPTTHTITMRLRVQHVNGHRADSKHSVYGIILF